MSVTLKIWSEARQRFYAVEGSEACSRESSKAHYWAMRRQEAS